MSEKYFETEIIISNQKEKKKIQANSKSVQDEIIKKNGGQA